MLELACRVPTLSVIGIRAFDSCRSLCFGSRMSLMGFHFFLPLALYRPVSLQMPQPFCLLAPFQLLTFTLCLVTALERRQLRAQVIYLILFRLKPRLQGSNVQLRVLFGVLCRHGIRRDINLQISHGESFCERLVLYPFSEQRNLTLELLHFSLMS